MLTGNAAEDFLDTPRAKVTRIRRGTCRYGRTVSFNPLDSDAEDFAHNSARAKLRHARILDYVNTNRDKELCLSNTVAELEKKCSQALHIPDLSLAILRNFAAEEILERFTREELCEAVNTTSPPRGCSPLHLAIYKNNVPVVKALLNLEGIDIDKEDDAGHSALHIAVIFGNFQVVQLLAKAGADFSRQNRASQSVIQAAHTLGHREAMEIVLAKFALIDLVRMYVRRFLGEMFTGNPDYYHYRTKEYRDGLLLAYTLTWQPRCISHLKLKHKIPIAQLFETEEFLEDFDVRLAELFPEDEEDKDDEAKNKGKSKRKSIFALWKAKDRDETDESTIEDGDDGGSRKLPQIGRGLGFQGYKLFRYVRERKLRELIEKAKRWELDSDRSLQLLCKNVFDNSLTPVVLKEKVRFQLEVCIGH